MKNEISELLSNISKEDFERFGDFILSPYFNKLPRLIKLYDYIKDNFTEIEQDNITRENISAFMYPGETFKNDSIRKLLSDFWKLLERFLAQEEFEKNEWEKSIYILKGLRTQHYDDKFFQRLKSFKKEHENSNQEIDEFYETNTKLISEEYEYWYFSKFDKNNEINQEKSDAHDYEFIAKKLFLFQYMLSREYVNKDLKYRYDFFNEIKDYVKKNEIKIKKYQPLLYQTYLGIILAYNGFTESDLREVKDSLDNQKFYKKKISKPYWDYINYCSVFINKNDTKYLSDIFSYLELMRENNLILENGELIHYYFKAAVDSSLYCKEFDWTETFIHEFGKNIKHDFREDMINLSYAKLFLAQNNLQKSKEAAEKISFKDYIHYIAAKKILARIAYEEDDLNKIISINDSIKKFFASHKEIPKVYRTSAIGYFEKIIQLLRIKEKSLLKEKMEYEVGEYKKSLENEKEDISFKEWLLEKANQL